MVVMETEREAIRHPIGPGLIYASVGVVLLLWLLASPLSTRIESSAATLKSLANVAAFSGTILYAWSVFLSARLLIFDDWFGGMDKAYKWHHYTGALAFFLLALHPLFLSFRAASVGRSVSTLWLLGSNWQINYGIIALYAIALLLPISIFMRIKYDWFIWMHRIIGGVFFLGFLHAFLAHGNMVRFWPLWLYVFVFSGIALGAYVYHSLLGGLLKLKYRYRVASVNALGKDTFEVILDPAGSRLLPFVAGQYAYVSFPSHPMGAQAHPFSMAAGPRQRQLRFVIKSLGDYTALMKKIPTGTTAWVAGPHGRFNFRRARKYRQVWVAGGIGVTPFLSMAQALPKRKYHVDFFYCVVTAGEAHFDTELQDIARRNPAFKPHLFCQDKEGFIDAKILAKTCDVDTTEFFICGPPPMMHALQRGLVKAGVPESRIHFEDFSLR